MTYELYASVITDVALDKKLDYGIPKEFLDVARQGSRVEIRLRGALTKGYIYEVKDRCDYPKVQPINNIVSDTPQISKELFSLALWMSTYYCTPLNRVIKVIVPAIIRKDHRHKEQLYVMRAKTKDAIIEICKDIRLKAPNQAAILDVMLQTTKGILLTELLEESDSCRASVDALVKKGVLKVDIVRVDRSPLMNEEYFPTKPKKLSAEQSEALEKITGTLDRAHYETHLLFGITGSGKTEVYLQAIDHAMKQGKGTIMLVPEISLTHQTIERFRSRFDHNIAILHHRLSTGERFDEWHKIYRGEARIVIGARSAIFSPVTNLGLIIVDEEHEQSYKQSEEPPFYHARDIAVMRGHMSKCAVVLGSATPCLESFHNAVTGKYTLSRLSSRHTGAKIPLVTIVDMKKEFEKAQGFTNFSNILLSEIKKRQEAGEQTILFLNRRGYHTSMVCQQCGEAIKCKNCDVSLTYHKVSNILNCHLCEFEFSPPPRNCTKCGTGETMKYRGAGTELIEKSLQAILPEIRTIRLDADTTKHKGSHQKLLREFGSGKADVLIGTQMIAKGLHFPLVTLVGVLNSDPTLNMPDFRASETAFQLITQVAGRAGRSDLPGHVIIQTQMPENSTIQLAAKQDYEAFYEQEIAIRDAFGYPPASKMAKISFSGEDERKTYDTADAFRQKISQMLPQAFAVHPVIPAGYAKVKNRFRFHFLIRGKVIGPIAHAITKVKESFSEEKKIRITVDINPNSTFF